MNRTRQRFLEVGYGQLVEALGGEDALKGKSAFDAAIARLGGKAPEPKKPPKAKK